MTDWRPIVGAALGVGVGLGATGYGFSAGDIVISAIGAISTMAVALVGAWPSVLKADASSQSSAAQQLASEREALHEEHRALVADLRVEIKRLRALNDELEARLQRCEKEQDELIDKIQKMKQGIFSDTDLEIAKIVRERRAQRGENDE